MPGKFSLSGRPKPTSKPWSSSASSSRRNEPSLFSSASKSRPRSSYGSPSDALLNPSSSGPGRRSRSHETSERRTRPPSNSYARDEYDRPSASDRRDSRRRSVSPRTRPLSSRTSARAPRPRPRRDSSISDDDTRPSPRRPSLARHDQYQERPSRSSRPSYDGRRPSPSPPRSPLDERPRLETRRASHHGPILTGTPSRPNPPPAPPPAVHPASHVYTSGSQRPSPDPSRRPSYTGRYAAPAAGTAYRPSTPPKYRPQTHGNEDSKTNSVRDDVPASLRPGSARPSPRNEVPAPGGSGSDKPILRDDVPSSLRPGLGMSHHSNTSTPPVTKTQRPAPSATSAKPSQPNAEAASKPAVKPTAKPPSSSPPKPSGKPLNLFEKIPQALAAYSGLEMLTQHADTVKEWADWLTQIRDAPEEIQGLSAKAQTAKDTIAQIQKTLEARPDLVEGESGQRLRGQIEGSIKSTNSVLTDLTKMLQDLSAVSAKDGSVMSGLQEFYNSYKYRSEFEEKVKEADAQLQKELSGLSTLVMNLYTRSMMMPAPLGSSASVPPLKPTGATSGTPESKGPTPSGPAPSARVEPAELPASTPSPIPPESKKESPSSDLEPPPMGPVPGPSTVPPSPSVLGEEEANIGTRPEPVHEEPREDPKNKENVVLEPKKEPQSEAKRPPTANAVKSNPDEVLLDAVWDGNLKAAAAALKESSVSVCDQKGLTPLHLACERDNLAIAMLLLDHGADPNARANGGRTPLHLASRFASAATVELLVDDARANPNARTTDGRTPLHYAASSAEDGDEERREVVRVLRDWGADPTLEDAKGRTPRDVAQKRDYWDISSTLRRAEKRWEEDHPHGWFQRHGFRK